VFTTRIFRCKLKKKNFKNLHKCLLYVRRNFIASRSVTVVTDVSSHIFHLTKMGSND